MCASVYSSLLLFTLTTTATISILFGSKMATEGLPLVRQERSADYDDRGILAGEDFLSVFLRQAYQDTTTTTTTSEPSTLPMTWRTNNEVYDDSSYVRGTRSTVYLTSPFAQEEQQTNFPTTRNSAQELNSNYRKQSSSESSENDDGAIVRVSSSIGRTLIHKDNRHNKDDSVVTTDAIDQSFVASEEHPSIVAEANKSEFNVEESEPITRNSDLAPAGFGRGFPAGVQALTRSQNLGFNTDFLQDKIQPIQHTVIYHNTAKEGSQARSVSYSTVIQAVPQMTDEKHWDGERLPQHERHERHYDGNAYVNNFHNEKPKANSTKPQNAAAIQNHPIPEKNWEKPEQYYTTTRRNPITTERNWEAVYSPPSPRLPTVYGRPEQNYEVDESASVMTNGRAHGVQAAPTASTKDETKIGEGKKADDNQKVGYVVEGRNYRKYRVEERTADGFIVGEYGVVSHDDGSLRGVRYTADGTINPRLIYDALMKFLSL